MTKVSSIAIKLNAIELNSSGGTFRDQGQSHEQNRLLGGLRRSSNMVKSLALQSMSCTRIFHGFVMLFRAVGTKHRRPSHRIVQLILLIVSNRMI